MTSADTGAAASDAVTARALAWVVDFIDEFDPFKGGRRFDVAHGQRVTELATMLNSYVALTGDRDSPQVQALLAEALRHQQNRALTDRIMHSPAEFVLFADLYAALRRLGRDDPQQRELIQRVIDAGFLDQVERVPHRMMDVRLTLEWGEFRHRWKSLEELSHSSMFPREPLALHLDESSLYSLTHVIMFLYGFGTRMDAGSPLLEDQRARFGDTLTMLLVIAAQQHHWDLLCELLLCWDCLRLLPTRIYRKAWEVLLEQQGSDGAFPGPERALAFSDWTREADPSARRELYFAHHYHTTLVAVIAAAVHSNRCDLSRISDRPVAEQVTVETPTARHPSPRGRRVAIFRRAQDWLSYQLDSCDADASLHGGVCERAYLEILVGAFICSEVSGERGFVQDIAHRVSHQLGDGVRAGMLSDVAPPALAIIGAAILHQHNDLTRNLDAALARFANVLARHRASDAATDLEWCEKRILLYKIGLHSEPPRLSRDNLFAFAETVSMSSDFPLIEQLALHVDSFTACGTADISLRSDELWLPELIIGLASHRFRENEFRRATRLMRTASALAGSDHAMLTQCCDFIILHQDMQGAFGFFGPAQSEVLGNAPKGFSFDRDLRLPVTLDCIWSLAECGGEGWRLFDSLPKMSPEALATRQSAT